MRLTLGEVRGLLLLSLVDVFVCSRQVLTSNELDENLEDNDYSSSDKQGSWSHWWSYEGISGPEYWNINKRWRLCSSGREQSPIEIRTERLVYDHLLAPFRLTWLEASNVGSSLGTEDTITIVDSTTRLQLDSVQDSSSSNQPFSSKKRVHLLNSARGLEIWLIEQSKANQDQVAAQANDQLLILSRGPLTYPYALFKIEFHTSATNSNAQTTNSQSWAGSEHLIDGRAFDAEIQLHFYNRALFSSAREAQRHADQNSGPSSLFAILSVFLVSQNEQKIQEEKKSQTQTKNSSSSQNIPSNLLDLIIKRLESDNNEKSNNRGKEEKPKVELELSYEQLESLVTSKSQYIHYKGSLNKPPCTEGVDWILVNSALRVESVKLAHLLSLLAAPDNIRPTQPLNGRLLRTSISQLQISQPDSVNNRQPGYEKQLRVSAGCLSTGKTEDTGSKQNCTNQERSKLTGQKSKGFSSSTCSMKPHYAYQLTSQTSKSN